MKHFYATLVVIAAVIGMGSVSLAFANQDSPKAAPSAPNLSGLHDFDFFVGTWRAHHRKLKERLAGSHDWVEFDGTLTMHELMNGHANEDESIFNVRIVA